MKPTKRDMKTAERLCDRAASPYTPVSIIAQAIANERARCARVCRKRANGFASDRLRQCEARDCADAIIASGGKP